MAYEQNLPDDATYGFQLFALFVLDGSIPATVCDIIAIVRYRFEF